MSYFIELLNQHYSCIFDNKKLSATSQMRPLVSLSKVAFFVYVVKKLVEFSDRRGEEKTFKEKNEVIY